MTLPERIDDPIAAAARSFVEADPSPALRARVLARLEEPAPTRWPWWIAAPTAASLAVAALMAGRAVTTITLPHPASPPASADRQTLVAPIIDVSALDWNLATRVRTSARPAAGNPPVSAAEAAWFSAAVQPIPTPGLEVPAVTQPAPVAVALLDVEALVASPVSVRPLDADRDKRAP